VKRKDLVGSWKDVQTTHSVSEDGKRFLFAACVNEGASHEDEVCDVTIYGLPSGAVLQRHQLPKLHFERYFAFFPQSPSGKYFALQHQNIDVVVWDAMSKAKVFGDPEKEEHQDFVWLGEDKVVFTGDFGGEVHIVALPDGTDTVADMKLDKHETAFRTLMSPNHKRIATDLKLNSGIKIAITNIEDGKTVKHAIPKSVCPMYCVHRWVNDATIEVRPEASNNERPATWTLLDATTGALTTSAPPPPSFMEAKFEVRFGDDRTADGISDGGRSNDEINTPTGKHLSLPPHRGRAEVAGGRLLLTSPHYLRVIDGDGALTTVGDGERNR
jgi:hypothetical protein